MPLKEEVVSTFAIATPEEKAMMFPWRFSLSFHFLIIPVFHFIKVK